jgi:hypothetical protein
MISPVLRRALEANLRNVTEPALRQRLLEALATIPPTAVDDGSGGDQSPKKGECK